jgi:hypothetical protein
LSTGSLSEICRTMLPSSFCPGTSTSIERREKPDSPPRRKKPQAAAGLLVVGLQQRLLSSIEAFARSLAVHRATVERHWEETAAAAVANAEPASDLLATAPDVDDERAEWEPEEVEAEEAAQIEAANAVAEAETARDAEAEVLWAKERELLDRMQEIAEAARQTPDAKLRYLFDWIRENLCPELPPFGKKPAHGAPEWNDQRVIVFTESREGTKRYLRTMLEHAIQHTDRADERIEVIDGLTRGPRRKEIQRRFNTDPARDPLRILIATDAAREGLNFQAHCADLFHFDLPWNPGRIEQRNGRIDRKLQPADEVRCHYFVLPQRAEDRVLDVLARKTETIKKELGSLSKVIDDDIERRLRRGIRHAEAEALARELEEADLEEERKELVEEELESARERQDDLRAQIERCRSLLDTSRRWTQFDVDPFRSALSCSLELVGAGPLEEIDDGTGARAWKFPELDGRTGADPSWTATLDSLRVPRKRTESVADWRREAPIRPVIFEDAGVLTEDTVHMHLEQRVAQRLLARFRAQGFVYHDLSRACLAQSADSIPRVILFGRLCLYGRGAERLHEELVPLAARWLEPTERAESLKPYAADAEARTLAVLKESLVPSGRPTPTSAITDKLLASAPRDVAELLPQLAARAEEAASEAVERLQLRGEREAFELHETLEAQEARVRDALTVHERDFEQLVLHFADDERRQLETNMRSWRTRLEQFESDLETEPDRIRDFYEVRATRLEPVGLVYLWPESN